ncbi:serine/threonine-protein kinase-like protein CCR2 [Malania oleifera]|uniref:serine/threonine-protein kinase-like protein CCR2 n=1 Tax=Malania oleifera TaxID=397392 RepID=UPI0025AE00E8|nr:serine/threonine-protein kinase-like protein CCR2 [Malania oleifera]
MNHAGTIADDILLAFLSVSLIIFSILLIIICRKKPIESEETLPVKPSAQAYSLTDVDAATDGFNHGRIIGKGRLGTVYAAIMARGELVAVKRIHPRLVLSNAGFGFSSIVKSLSLADHPNIVPIVGFSQAPGERIILTEFVDTVSLDFYLHQNSDGEWLLDWERRLRIAAGAARGLEYLHEGVAPHIVHGCVKASNILIDVRFCARVCDFGLSFLVPQGKGGEGACKEGDVYAFGLVLLELLSGRRSSEEGFLLVEWALPLIKTMKYGEFLDPRLVIPSNMNPLVRLAKVASACVGNSRTNRPSVVQVAAILNNLEVEICVR